MNEDIEHVGRLIGRAAGEHAERPALVAVDREPLSFGALPALVGGVAERLRERGIERHDRVALLVRNGPEAASAFLSLASAAVCAPLNPDYRRNELDFYLEDLRARAVVVGADVDAPVREAASDLEIAVLELEPRLDGPAGWFALDGPLREGDGGVLLEGRAEDTALLLHTSGTTSRPKLVPLSHGALASSAQNVSATLLLSPDDRCLNVMPLFHIHGLVAALLASLRSGASVACTPGFNPVRVFGWLRELEPTWYTAVPTMHQAILERWDAHEELVRGHQLRLARSSSASLPIPVLERLEQTLAVPVVEAYGMTEAAHQIASNPLPPGARVPGSVGRAAGPEIAVLGKEGELLPPGAFGEIAIRGSNVFDGYEANPEANQAAFADGWFRTGDEGVLTADGYLTLSGRLKELINRGGEKIAPIEVDERLLMHPAVKQAVTFALPDARLGEEVAAAVVLAPGSNVDEGSLQEFVAETIAPFKVPRRLAFVEEIPKGPTGKVQRIGLADRLGISSASPEVVEHVKPRTPLEMELAAIWSDVLDVEAVGVDDDFFALGGDSILGTEAVARIRDLTGRDDLPLVSIVRSPTVGSMARELEGTVQALVTSGAVAIRESGAKTPLFFVHGGDGEVLRFVPVARRLDDGRPVYGLRARGIDGGAIPDPVVADLAVDYVSELRAVQPHGPYVLGAFCMGATIVFEMARLLETTGEGIELMILVDPRFAAPTDTRYRLWLFASRFRGGRIFPRILGRLRRLASTEDVPVEAPTEVWQAFDRARVAHASRPSDVPAAVMFSVDYLRYRVPEWSVLRTIRGAKSVSHVDALHADLFRQPAVDELAGYVNEALARLDGRR